MYLVHTQLLDRTAEPCTPPNLADLLRALAHPADRVEHVVVHPHPEAGLTVGVYLLAEGLADAEQAAARLCERVVAEFGPLPGWQVGRSEAPLLAPYDLDGPWAPP